MTSLRSEHVTLIKASSGCFILKSAPRRLCGGCGGVAAVPVGGGAAACCPEGRALAGGSETPRRTEGGQKAGKEKNNTPFNLCDTFIHSLPLEVGRVKPRPPNSLPLHVSTWSTSRLVCSIFTNSAKNTAICHFLFPIASKFNMEKLLNSSSHLIKILHVAQRANS